MEKGGKGSKREPARGKREQGECAVYINCVLTRVYNGMPVVIE